LEFPEAWYAVVSGARLSATGASGLAVRPGDDPGDDARLAALRAELDGLVNEAIEAVDFVE
jgi:hypothetical protein